MRSIANERAKQMIPYKWSVAHTVPPTLQKRLEVAQAIQMLAAQQAEEVGRRRVETVAISRDLDTLRGDCALVEQTLRAACREAATIIVQSRACKRALARARAARDSLRAERGRTELPSPLSKARVDDPEHPGWPAHTPGGRGGKFRPKNGAQDRHPEGKEGLKLAARGKGNQAECDAQYDLDRFICRLVRSPLCWAQAMERYSACLAGRQIPPLNF